jgi:SAM-dependent methyltransferase
LTEATETLWQHYSLSNELNPAQIHRWRLIATEARACIPATDGIQSTVRPPEANVPPGATVIIDLGCGSGALLERVEAARPGARLIGLDVEPRALDLARARLPHAQFLAVDLCSGDRIESLRSSASLVLCSEVLEHLGQPEAAIRQARDLLAPQGRLIVTVPAGPITPFDRRIGHLHHYTLPEVSLLLSSNGFRLVRSYLWGFPFHTLFRMAIHRFPGAVEGYSDRRLGTAKRVVLRILHQLFFLNMRSQRLGRQIVAVAVAEAEEPHPDVVA